MHRTLFVGLIAVVAAMPCAASAKVTSAFGISIQSCVVNSSNGVTNGINVVYYNTHSTAATEVDFLVRYHHARYVLMDHGTFTQNAQINHNLTNALVGQAWEGATPRMCTVQRVYLANGKTLE
ncbi:MAG: hypothetical protein WAK16_10050 [Candidatus Cybelea sp.]